MLVVESIMASSLPPKNKKELFNLRQERFQVLDSEPFWLFGTHIDVALTCCIIHNFIIGFDPDNPIMEEMNRQMEFQRENPRIQLSQREEKEENKI